MAPEHPFPAPTNDCFTVVKYVIENYKEFKVDSEKLVIAGDSAGNFNKNFFFFFFLIWYYLKVETRWL